MMRKLSFDSRKVRQGLSLLVALMLVGSVSYLGEQFYNNSHAATGASMSVNPATDTWQPNSTHTVTIQENSGGEAVTGAQVYLTYDSSQLQYISMSNGDFPVDAYDNTTQPGRVVADRSINFGDSGVTNNHVVVNVTFKVLASSGSAAITIDPTHSQVLRFSDSTNILSSAAITNGSFTISTPTPPPAQATLNLAPATGSYAPDSTINVEIHEVSQTARVAGAEVHLQYPANQLTFLQSSTSTVFPTAFRDTNSNGVLVITRAIKPGASGVTGDNIVATLQFKVTGTSGSIPLAFNSSSIVYDDSGTQQNVLNLASSKGATYTVNVPPTGTPTPPPTTQPPVTSTPPPTQSGCGSSCGTQTGSNQSSQVVASSGKVTVSSHKPAGSVSQNGDNTQVQGEVDLTPITDTTGSSVTKVEYYLGTKLMATEKTPPYAYNFDTKKLKNGTYNITIKTYYDNGTVDSSTDKLSVHNPVTISYILAHYSAPLFSTILVLAIVGFALFRFVLPRWRGGGGLGGGSNGGYDGYVGYASPATGSRPDIDLNPIAADPTVITPTAPEDEASIEPTQEAAVQNEEPLAMPGVTEAQASPEVSTSPTPPTASPKAPEPSAQPPAEEKQGTDSTPPKPQGPTPPAPTA